MLNPLPLFWLAAGLLALTSLLVVLSALLERSGPIRLRHFAEETGGQVSKLFDSPPRFEAFRYLLSFLAKAMPAALCVTLMLFFLALEAPPLRAAVLAFTVAGLLALMVELANRVLLGRDPEAALSRLTLPYRFSIFLLAPAVSLVALFLPGLTDSREEQPEEEDEASEEEIEAFIDVGTREGILEPDQGDLVRGVVDFGETQVKSVMTPRVDIVAASASATLEELVPVFIESKCSRLPLYEESIDHVVGILHIRDLLAALYTPERPPARQLAKPAYVVPISKPLDELLRELQARRTEMAIVVDEYGGTAGLVTVEDLVEEIVGDLGDEHEDVDVPPEELSEGRWRLEGRTHLEELEELAGIEIEPGPYETVGGLILSLAGKVPEPGTVIENLGLVFTVDQVSERRIEWVTVEKATAAEEAPDG